MRVFVAIRIPDFEFPYKKMFKLKTIKWIPKENYHLTLCFLGSIGEEKLPLIKDSIGGISKRFRPLELNLHGVGAFPKESYSKVLWIGLEENLFLKNLQLEIEQKLKSLGFELEIRDYLPHFTIGRCKEPLNLENEINTIRHQFFKTLRVNELILFESKTGSSNPVYSEILTFPLGS